MAINVIHWTLMIEQDVPHYKLEVTSGPSERYAMPASPVSC